MVARPPAPAADDAGLNGGSRRPDRETRPLKFRSAPPDRGHVDEATLISSVVSAQMGSLANQRVAAVAASAARTQEATVATLLEAIQASAAAYDSTGAAGSAAAPGATFQGVA